MIENRGLRERHHDTIADVTPLDNPVWHALTGPHAEFCEGTELAVRYDPDVSPFSAMPDRTGPDTWDALEKLYGPGGAGALVRNEPIHVPAGWTENFRLSGLQMIVTAPIGEPDAAFVTLGDADVPEMLALVGRTRPGPFFTRTHTLGTYVGLRENGALVAMAGERMRCAGHTEISAVCTDESARNRGLATRLVRAIAAGIEGRGDIPMLHVASNNTGAIRLYETLGFETRTEFDFVIVQAPQ
jgi:ribosomal protein S18 acetylase RimI-like enzyme